MNVRARRKELGVPEKQHTPILAFWMLVRRGIDGLEINNVYKENLDIIQRLGHVSSESDDQIHQISREDT